ncbi:MAG: DUF4139 domain-containing protein [Rikenellaceae bacterium]|nr:DUF4139 domain-containing protein [Rikenellaceae bacterium]
MKFFLLACLPLSLAAQERELRPASTIDGVTVFLNNAQITRTANVQLRAGTNRVVFENLPRWIDQQSLQASGKGNFTILSVAFELNHLKSQEKSPEVSRLEKSLDSLRAELRRIAANARALQAEDSMLQANRYIGGQNGVDATRLREVSDFFRIRIADIKTRRLKVDEERLSVTENVRKIQEQLQSVQSQPRIASGEVVLTVAAPSDLRAPLTISYIVNGAGWTPTHDVRAVDTNQPLSLVCKAQVYQNTGEDWKNIKLTLSTGNPAQSGVKPTLYPWYLDYYEPVRARGASSRQKLVEEVVMHDMAVVAEETTPLGSYAVQSPVPKAASAAVHTQQTDGTTTIEYAIGVPCDVPTGGKPQGVEYKKLDIPAAYEYYAVAKLDKDAFLLARATGWEEYNLIPGEASLFFEGTYVGKSYIDPRAATDTLDLSLGRDKGIVITRVKGADFASRQSVGSSRREVRSWNITVRNMKRQPVTLVLEDQVPVSTNKDIEVTANQISGAAWDKDTGRLTWRLTLAPGESKPLTIKYEVKYPKNRQIVLE